MQITVNTPCYFLTSVTHKRLPVFRTDIMRQILVNALDEARRSADILIFAYVIMIDHMHIITDGKRTPSDTLRYINGITARRVIDHLKNSGHQASLEKLQQETKKDGYKYSLWHHHSDKFLITSESMMMQKVNYVHQNPVAAELVESAFDYKYSSARFWLRRSLFEDEPLGVDIKDITWRNC